MLGGMSISEHLQQYGRQPARCCGVSIILSANCCQFSTADSHAKFAYQELGRGRGGWPGENDEEHALPVDSHLTATPILDARILQMMRAHFSSHSVRCQPTLSSPERSSLSL